MRIRHATGNDAAVIAEIQIDAWRAAYQKFMPSSYLESLSVDDNTQLWSEYLKKTDGGEYVVVEYKNLIVGFCVYGRARDKDISSHNVGELAALNILPYYWGRGLGTVLLKHVLAQAKLNTWTALYLWVIKQNKRARSLYECFGFELDGYEKIETELTGNELHEIRYLKSLC